MITLFILIWLTISPGTFEIDQPRYNFKSTSYMLPTETNKEYSQPFSDYSAPRRAIIDDDDESPGYRPNDPMMTPVGDPIIPTLLILLSYLELKRKTK